MDHFEAKSFTIRNIASIYYLFDFYNVWMIFVRIENISNKHDGVFKIDAKVFSLIPLFLEIFI